VEEAVAAMAHCPFGSFLISSCLMAHWAPASFAVVSAEEPSAAGAGEVDGALVVAGVADAGAGEVGLIVLGVSFLQPPSRNARAAAQITNLEQPFIVFAPGMMKFRRKSSVSGNRTVISGVETTIYRRAKKNKSPTGNIARGARSGAAE
jgi:hypothetical protein